MRFANGWRGKEKDTMCDKNLTADKNNMKDELLKQLHEQYAINNNANLNTIVTLVVAVIAVIGCFGYVYVHTDIEFSQNFGCLVKCCKGVFYLDVLFLAYLASVFVLALLTRLCIYQGVAQRKEQIIIHAIRQKYFGKNYLDEQTEDKIFPNGYTPYRKEGLQIVQGLYGELVKIFIGVFLILSFAVLLKVISNVINYRMHSVSLIGIIVVVISIVCVFLANQCIRSFLYRQIKSYKVRENEFSKLRPMEQKKKEELPKMCKKCRCILSNITKM